MNNANNGHGAPAALSDNEKSDIIEHLDKGRPLPDKYRFLLFADKREVELVWHGKNNDVANIALPFQIIEQVDEPRAERTVRLQPDFFSADGRQLRGWTNKLIWGDNKLILSSLVNGPLRAEIERQGGIKLIYIDPPFDVGADFSMNLEVGGGSFTKQPNILEELAYRDTWGKGTDSFIAMIYERLVLMRSLLADDGSIYVHCDWRVNSYIRLVLDEVFGKNNMLNEIIWCYGEREISKDKYNTKHDNIYFYAKDANATSRPFVSHIDAEVRRDKKSRKVSILLTNFSVYYNQDSVRLAEESLGIGKSKIVVDRGRIIRVSKDKSGGSRHDLLTQSWQDWVDYWAVDYSYESRREMVQELDISTGEERAVWTGDYVFENEWQSFRTKQDRGLELESVAKELPSGKHKIAVKVVDIFGNDTMQIMGVIV